MWFDEFWLVELLDGCAAGAEERFTFILVDAFLLVKLADGFTDGAGFVSICFEELLLLQ